MSPQVEEKLNSAKISSTLQRNVLSRLFLEKHRHCTAETLYNETKAEGYNFSRATIYNTLRTFVKKGIAREVLVHDGRQFFDSRVDEHHHFYNQNTGEICDIPYNAIPVETINNILKQNQETANIRVTNLIVRGSVVN